MRAWCAVQTQWRHAEGYPTGLDYAGARAGVEAMGIEWGEVFEGLRVMEAETLKALTDRRAKR